MSVYAKVWAYDQHPLQVDKDGSAKDDTRNPAAKAVLVALAEYPGVGQRECWPSQDTLSAMTDFDVRTVRKHLDVLEKQGYIARKERHRDGKRTTDMVTLLGPKEVFGPSPTAAKKQPERGAGREQSNRNVVPKQPERGAGEPVVEPVVSTPTNVGDAEASQDASQDKENVNYMTVFCEASKVLGYKLAPEDRRDLPKNLKTVAAEGHDDTFMRKVVRRCLTARDDRQHPLSPQRARDELLGNVTPIKQRKQSENRDIPEEAYDREAY